MGPASGHGQDAPDVIYIIRHGEKPDSLKHGPQGYDLYRQVSINSLTDQGWQRAWGLAKLFGRTHHTRAGITRPDHLFSPSYGADAVTTGRHRANETIRLLALKTGQGITADFPVGQESAAIAEVLKSGPGVKLVCWEHNHIPDLAAGLTLAPGTVVPQVWPDDRFDVIWRFQASRRPDGTVAFYTFSQLPQLVLKTDLNSVITAAPPSIGGNGLAA